MKKVLLFVMMAVAAVVFTGCASVNVADKLNGEQLGYSGKSVAHIEAENWGLYLFMIPLITGDTANPGKTVFLQDTVKVSEVCKVLSAEAKKMGGKYTIDVVSAPATTPFFFGMKSVQVSANIIK